MTECDRNVDGLTDMDHGIDRKARRLRQETCWLLALTIPLAWALLPLTPALAAKGTQMCYVPTREEGPPTLHEKPSKTAKVVGKLEPGQIIVRIFKVRDRGGWQFVHWFRQETDKKPAGKGWVVALEVHGGECED